MQTNLFGETVVEKDNLKLKYGANPFTILDAKDPQWQMKKKRWIKLGIKSEIGRDAPTYHIKEWAVRSGLPTDKSVFDPVLCELIYRWFCPTGGSILDPLAGGSVRGIVANYLGYAYTGIDIRQEQVDSNREQAVDILPIDNQPQWYVGDSNALLESGWNKEFDLIFTCPPYVNLEVYSDLDGDISNMNYGDFIRTFESIMTKACRLLKSGGMAVLVVGEVRDKNGNYYGFVPDTIKFMQRIDGMAYYNEAILATMYGSAAIRANGNMKSRKLAKVHQNVIMFKKQ